MYVYVNGKWTKDTEAVLPVFDLAVLRGFGIFDFLRTYKHVPFLLNEHLDRLWNSARLLQMTVPVSQQELKKIIAEGLKRNAKSAKDFNIRIVVTGGISPDSISIGTPSLIVLYTEAHDYPPEFYTKGIKVTTFRVKRFIPEAKSINYMAGVLELKKARVRGATEIIHIDETGDIYEGMTSNFYAVINGEIVTRPSEILEGITKKVVRTIAKDLKIPFVERTLNISELKTFDEVFVTASNKEIMPVNTVNETTIGSGEAGSITSKLIAAYRKQTRK
jgi:branched-chain amino acid aminotransferase